MGLLPYHHSGLWCKFERRVSEVCNGKEAVIFQRIRAVTSFFQCLVSKATKLSFSPQSENF